MKAYSLYAVGDLRYEEVAKPNCKDGWCIVKVKAAGICSSDVPRVFKKGTYHFPTVPGHEFAGIVESVSNPEHESLIGKSVGVFPLIPCRKCAQCEQQKFEMCENYDYLGSRSDGGFSEYVAVPVWNIVELDENISFMEAAMLEPLAVSLHAIKKLNIGKADRVAIVGTGMIAFAAAQWAQKMGASYVVVLGRNENKRRIAESIDGIQYAVYNDIDEEFDAVLEAVGSSESICKSIDLVSAGGRLVLMGNPEGDIILSQNTYWKILRKQLCVMGTWNSSYRTDNDDDWKEAIEAIKGGGIKVKQLVSHAFSQDHLMDGLVMMRDRKEPYCKVMTVWNEED